MEKLAKLRELVLCCCLPACLPGWLAAGLLRSLLERERVLGCIITVPQPGVLQRLCRRGPLGRVGLQQAPAGCGVGRRGQGEG